MSNRFVKYQEFKKHYTRSNMGSWFSMKFFTEEGKRVWDAAVQMVGAPKYRSTQKEGMSFKWIVGTGTTVECRDQNLLDSIKVFRDYLLDLAYDVELQELRSSGDKTWDEEAKVVLFLGTFTYYVKLKVS